MTDTDSDIVIDSPGATAGETGETRVRVFLTQSALDTMNQHAASEPHHEVGGIMVGSVAHDVQTFVIVEAAIPGQHMTHTRGSVTFTHDSWAAIYREIDSSHPDKRIVGWYHSHPGFGIFLSEHDLFIHRNFFAAPWQVAFVTDPKARTCGLFTWQNGQIGLYADSQVFTWSLASLGEPVEASTDSLSPADETVTVPVAASPAATPRPYLSWAMGLLAALLVLLGGLTLSTHGIAKRTQVAVDALRAEVRSIAVYVQEAERVSDAVPSPPLPLTKSVSPGPAPEPPQQAPASSATVPTSRPMSPTEEPTPDGAAAAANQTN